MTVLGIELSDAGIMAAAGDPPRILETDGGEKSSPGFALSLNDQLIMGRDALSRFRLNPRSYTNRFWDDLSSEPIKQPGLEGKTYAELAYRHLSKLWDVIKNAGNEVVMAVPGFYTQHQLGLLLGIANELYIPVKGFAPIALAGSSAPHLRHPLLHLDIHLHRFEITFLEQSDYLILKEVKTIAGRGFNYLYTEWVKMVADEFVRTTRFDPFDQAAYEQELYNRLPRAIEGLQPHASATFTLQAGAHSYRVPLTYDLFAQKTEAVLSEVRRIIEDMMLSAGFHEKAPVLQITQRVSHLPGCKEALYRIPSLALMQLEPGAGALGALKLRDSFSPAQGARGVTLLSSRPLHSEPAHEHRAVSPGHPVMQPTHILHGDRAYPVTVSPLIVGTDHRDGGATLRISSNPAEISQRCCIIKREGNAVILVNEWPAGTLVNDRVILQASALELGQTIRVGTRSYELKLIACVD
jgi:hypothetical protein